MYRGVLLKMRLGKLSTGQPSKSHPRWVEHYAILDIYDLVTDAEPGLLRCACTTPFGREAASLIRFLLSLLQYLFLPSRILSFSLFLLLLHFSLDYSLLSMRLFVVTIKSLDDMEHGIRFP
jgi:hypothetical protein